MVIQIAWQAQAGKVRIVSSILVVLALAACEPRGSVVVDPAAARSGRIETLFIGTTRGADTATGEAFGKVRSPVTRFVRIDVAIPPQHVTGEISWPEPNRPADPATDFLAVQQKIYADANSFRADLGAELVRNPRRQREAVVFVHGFNNNFAEGAYRLAQIGNDIGIEGALVHYSWPSRANPLGYAYDRDSALFARDGLETLLREVAAAGAERILIVAHSMGSSLTMETLRQIALRDEGKLLDRVSGVMLVSPDIDVDVFRAQAERIGDLPQPFVIFSSKRDRALALSARLTGQRDRLGNVGDVTELADLKVTLLDTTAFSKGSGHFNPGESPSLIAILGRLAEVDSAFAQDRTGRTGLLPGAVLTVQNATQVVLSPVTAISQIQP